MGSKVAEHPTPKDTGMLFQKIPQLQLPDTYMGWGNTGLWILHDWLYWAQPSPGGWELKGQGEEVGIFCSHQSAKSAASPFPDQHLSPASASAPGALPYKPLQPCSLPKPSLPSVTLLLSLQPHHCPVWITCELSPPPHLPLPPKPGSLSPITCDLQPNTVQAWPASPCWGRGAPRRAMYFSFSFDI